MARCRRAHSLYGRTAVVTGAARGVGSALAWELARRGAHLALLDHDGDALRRVASSLPTEVHCWSVDVTRDGAMARVAEEVRERLGEASVVVANAGIAEGGPFAESDPMTWRRVIEVNLIGSAITARAFLPDLLSTRGYFLQVASLASIGAAPLMSSYCASKAGVESFTQSLRAELAAQHVRVGIAYLNWTETDMVRDADQYSVLRELRAHMPPPARKVYRPEWVAARLATAVERRSTAVYTPAWLRSVQVVRAALPIVVTHFSRRELPRLAARTSFEATGLLGAGGRADAEAALRRADAEDSPR
ncbi:SDR family oxidoreductase [Streptomyces sp. RPA4-5]|uniref:SDR family oxidoreductase n=1 Tax=Streptomyces TaxID=1883 RepID=UPI00143EF39C|nr:MULTISPECIES: SDR family oxidoreductase [Streptomyces]MCX4637053.1 SDR family oxidoreductase [Streptomyces platensis]QIY54169.1 SDR family oxidoreductase [Streptomyces sp. RPA4-5]WJY36773.1 SDR family oxidoreductase [Streptomyces sp. P9-2B-2]